MTVYFLDANVFMYAAGRPHPLKDPCVHILRQAAVEAIRVVTSTEVLQEILYRYSAIGRHADGLNLARLAIEQVAGDVLPVQRPDIERALALLQRYGDRIKTRDAVHAATSLNNGVSHIISADGHFDLIEEVTRIPPESFTEGS